VFVEDLPVGERMNCPFTENYCQYLRCALWDVEAKCCALVAISNTLQGLYVVIFEKMEKMNQEAKSRKID